MDDIELRLLCETKIDRPRLQFRKRRHVFGNALAGKGVWTAWEDVPFVIEPVAESKTLVKAESYGLGVNITDYVGATTETTEVVDTDKEPQYLLSDPDIDSVFNSMPDGPQGFCKTWGYRHFAKRLMTLIGERLVK